MGKRASNVIDVSPESGLDKLFELLQIYRIRMYLSG